MRLLLLPGLLAGSVAAPSQTTPPQTAPAYRLETITAAAAAPSAADTLLRLPWPLTQVVAKRRGTLTLPLRSGAKTLRDYHQHTDFDGQVGYQHHGYLAAVRLHLVEVTYYESTEWWLVSYDTGAVTRLWNRPQFSPNQQRVATYSAGLEYSAVPNGVQVFQVTPGRLTPLVTLRPDGWEPQRLAWRDNRTLDVQAKVGPNLEHTVYKRLTLR
ncbi:hypothetical protein EJV47_21375 [Hymenobacter gummosus]|uniref:Uncharacterized protein n=1 Tax=Hymenobacter gummosus TaxID=1776032 RepID=A0A431TXM8_9BACT|nr:hypothetical protein [Hymenobacter gummosus]RTQ46508.1 hypothetical protein EJV47_21375 [Hymenobacter gummosus]